GMAQEMKNSICQQIRVHCIQESQRICIEPSRTKAKDLSQALRRAEILGKTAYLNRIRGTKPRITPARKGNSKKCWRPYRQCLRKDETQALCSAEPDQRRVRST